MTTTEQLRRPARHHGFRTRVWRLVLALGLAVALGSCGDPAGEPTGSDPSVRAADFLITSAALPQGWADSNSQGLDYRVTVCGVDLEPEPPARAASIASRRGRWARSWRSTSASTVTTWSRAS